MAPRGDTRSPSPAGSRSARKHRKDDDLYDRSRRDDHRNHGRLSRSRSPADRRYRDGPRDHRDRGRDHDGYRRRDRSLDRRQDGYYGSRRDGGGARDRRRSRSRGRGGDKPRSPDRRRQRSRDAEKDQRGSRIDDPREKTRDRRDGTTESRPRSRGSDSRRYGQTTTNGTSNNGPETAKSAPTQTQSEADKEAERKAERLRKLQAWKEKHAAKEAKENEANPLTTRKLLAEMDQKATGTPTIASPSVASPVQDGASTPRSAKEASPLPYAGKFDPKAIAKAKASARSHSPTKLGEIKGQPPVVKPAAFTSISKASALPAKRAISGFGFSKAAADADKASSKRKLDLDDEETTKRKLLKLPEMALEETNDGPEVGQDEDDEGDDVDDFDAGTEEEAAAAARAAHERREERILQQSMAMQTDEDTKAESEEKGTAAPEPESMEVDEEEVDPLDAFMAGLDDTAPVSKPKSSTAKPVQEPEAYFDDDDYGFEEKDDADPASILAMAAKRKQKKDIPTIDYSKIKLNPIRKNFWVEPYELSQLTEEEADLLRLELDGIKVSGKNVPKPVQKWSHCGLTRPILDTIEKLGYEKPTPIQMQALPIIMSGRDVVGVAKTGSGKTMAFLLPMFRHIKDQEPVGDTDGPIGLIMTPTRELAVQIHRECKPFAKVLGLRAVAVYGGAPIKDQIAELKRGAEIVVATPGRMIDLLAANQGRVTNLKRASFLVLDEADRMFDMGFGPQVKKIFANVRPDRQTILFSATMPRMIDTLTKEVLRDPIEITVGGKSVVAKEITQIVEIREEKDKFVRTLELLGELYRDDDDVRALIFVERQEKADDLLRELLRRGYGCMSLHGGKDQSDRDSTISDFKAGICPILIATSVAARGLDVKQLKLVINYDAPNHLEDYVHRAGRTGRAGNTGTAVTFVTPEQEDCAVGIAKAMEQSGQPVPERLAEMAKAHKKKVKEGKAKDSSGFGGKGLERLDKEREAARLRERKSHKTEGDDDDVKEEDDKEDEKKKKAATAIQSAASAIQSRDAAKAEEEIKSPVNMPPIKASAVTAGKAGGSGGGALDKAASAISQINARLAKAGQLRPGQSIDNKGPDAGAFHATLEINDFPQKARWAVTNRTNVAKILDSTGTSITTKGNYYAPGKEPPPGGEPKLYILIEGDTEVAVGNALAEMTRLLKEGTIAAADAESRAPASGRYTIT
ncbi:p-loop containing nucleoside triphosphate hydrolase protein [Coniochaeta hoffmannii]|uniref:RNA helicase n=1 Tax=Coniochaeta hoffmannii TaxID=91930 RepID=A0AA38VES0_9PEZI|nr:p-loop containing nucleoside triphosphate hydrolase protein [Coniochaeta hoffmannii]